MIEDILKARKAIIEHIKDARCVSGAIDCPVCEKGKLKFSRASNGHVHAKCKTQECVSWME
jgi:hypothetical protein